MKSNKMKLSIGDQIFDYTNVIIMLILSISTLYPFLYLISMSFTSVDGAASIIGGLLPINISYENYARVFKAAEIWRGFGNTIYRTILGTTLQLLFITLTAYPLSKRYFPHRTFWTSFIIFTMFFSGGLIPNYLLVTQLHLKNTVWSLILPGLIPTYNMIIMRNFFMAIPNSLEEAARIDGANDYIILFKLVIPISMPIIATVGLWQLVAHWNAWFDAMIYITDTDKQVLQIVLRRVVLEGTTNILESG